MSTADYGETNFIILKSVSEQAFGNNFVTIQIAEHFFQRD